MNIQHCPVFLATMALFESAREWYCSCAYPPAINMENTWKHKICRPCSGNSWIARGRRDHSTGSCESPAGRLGAHHGSPDHFMWILYSILYIYIWYMWYNIILQLYRFWMILGGGVISNISIMFCLWMYTPRHVVPEHGQGVGAPMKW